jgi:RNA 2',3'-cyclic 3'-phosphodiesterase
MRLFIAVPLPEAVTGQIDTLVRQVRPQLPGAAWVRREAQHITLAFLGEQDPAVPERAARAVAGRVAGARRFQAALGGCGFFPDARRARVAWIGFEPADALAGLARAVREGLAEQSVSFDEKPFRPHLTLARIRERWRAEDTARFESAFSGFRSSQFTVDEAVLYSSRLSPGGAVHAAVHRFALG